MAATDQQLPPINEDDLKDLKERMKLIVDADPAQYHNEYSLRRYLRAFKTVDSAFQVFILRNFFYLSLNLFLLKDDHVHNII